MDDGWLPEQRGMAFSPPTGLATSDDEYDDEYDDDDGAGAGMRSAGFVLDTPDQYFGASFSEFDR
jgi:hypothetical protein